MSKLKNQCGVALMSLLRNYETEFVFGIPGVHTVELYRGIAEAGIQHITPRHEQSAAFMADGYSRATGKVGVCCLITGPGVTNAATPLAQSYSDSVPVLAISSVNKTQSLNLGQGDLHEIPHQQQLTEHFTAFSQTILGVNSIPEVVARAFAVFDSMRPQPVHIEIPIDLMCEPVTWSDNSACRVSSSHVPLSALKTAAECLQMSRSTAVILGGGCKDAAAEARSLVDLIQAPVVTTFAGKGIIPETHPLSLGANLLHPPVLDFIANRDVVLAVGTQLSETDIWHRGGDIQFNGSLIRIDIDPRQLYQNAIPKLALLGDARHALEEISSRIRAAAPSVMAVNRRSLNTVSELLSECPEHWYSYTGEHTAVWDVLRKTLPDDGIVAADSTQLVYSGNYYYPAMQPRTYLTSTTGYGTLGYALPAAIGAKLGKPESPVVCVAGDGGFLFTIQELATAAECQLPIVILLWHNDGYGEIRKSFEASDVPLVGVDLQMPDFLKLAEGFGCEAERIIDLEHFEKALISAFNRNCPTLLELRPEQLNLKSTA